MLSWGTKHIKIESKYLLFRLFCVENIRENVHGLRSFISSNFRGSIQTNTTKPLGRTVFLQIVDNLTGGHLKRKAAVDYALGTLVYDKTRTLLELVRVEMILDEDQKLCLSQLDTVEDFLKFTVLEHISADSDPPLDPGFASHGTVHNGDKVESQCVTFLSPFADGG